MKVHQKTAREFREEVLSEAGDRIISIVLYGSAARYEYRFPDSDIDILVILRERDKQLEDTISRISTSIDLENTTATSLVYLSRGEFEKFLHWDSPFLENVVEEGVILYDDGTFEQVRRGLVKASG